MVTVSAAVAEEFLKLIERRFAAHFAGAAVYTEQPSSLIGESVALTAWGAPRTRVEAQKSSARLDRFIEKRLHFHDNVKRP
jgi:hypothetical protein